MSELYENLLDFVISIIALLKVFLKLPQPLHNLTKKDQPWQWTTLEQHAFDTLKQMICLSPILIHADPEEKFQMETSASNYAYGAIPSQKGKDQKLHPVAFYLKSMSPAEWNYSISDRKALPIVKQLQHWRHWLEHTEHPVTIITDHHNLEYFRNPQALNW
jgi:hypothetical protein